MTTTTAPTDTTSAPVRLDTKGEGIPFVRLAGIEVRKMVDTRAGTWMLIVMAAIGFIVSGALVIWGNSEEQTFGIYLSFIAMPLLVLLPIMGIMSATQEWTQRTGLATFTLVPRRGRIVAAKIVAALVLALVLLAAGMLAASLATLVSGGDFGLSGISLLGLVVSCLLFTLQGVAFGALFLNTPIAIVSSLVLPTIWTVLTAMISWMTDVAAWLDLNLVTGPLMEGQMTGEAWAQLATASAAWIGLPLAIGTWRILTREVK